MPPLAPHLQQRRLPIQRPAPRDPDPGYTGEPPSSSEMDCRVLVEALMELKAVGRAQARVRTVVLDVYRRLTGRRISDRTLQHIVGDAVAAFHLPVGSTSRGYFLVATLDDCDASIGELVSRVHEHTRRIAGLRAVRATLERS